MTEVRSKRRVLPLIFIVKSFTKSLLMYKFAVYKKANGCKGHQKKKTVTFQTCCRGSDVTAVALRRDCY